MARTQHRDPRFRDRAAELGISVARDIRTSELFQEIEAIHHTLRRPGTRQISDAAEIHVSPDGRQAVFAATIVDTLHGTPPTRIALVDLTSGDTRIITVGANTDRLPKFSPDGRHIAFLSDRQVPNNFQLYLMDWSTGAALPTPDVPGWLEYLHWSPDGTRVLLGIAGHGADVAGGQGAITSQPLREDFPSWLPAIETGNEGYRWRSAWVYELASRSVHQVSPAECNVWESVWCGNSAIAAVVSAGPSEGLWYTAHIALIDIATHEAQKIFTPADQLGWPSASPSGSALAFVEAVCSDRWIVAGTLKLVARGSQTAISVGTQGVDIAYTEWRSEDKLLVAGHRGFETVVGLIDAQSKIFSEVWCSSKDHHRRTVCHHLGLWRCG
jgi:hypothetical protein